MIDIKFLIPEIFLSVSIFSLLIIGVFLKNSFEIIYKLSMIVIISILLIILSGNDESVKLFNSSFSLDNFSEFYKNNDTEGYHNYFINKYLTSD